MTNVIEKHVTLPIDVSEFRLFIYRGKAGIGTLEATRKHDDPEWIELWYTDAVSARSTKVDCYRAKR